MEYAGSYRYLTYASYVLSAISALVALVPFWFIWNMIRRVDGPGYPAGRRTWGITAGWP